MADFDGDLTSGEVYTVIRKVKYHSRKVKKGFGKGRLGTMKTFYYVRIYYHGF